MEREIQPLVTIIIPAYNRANLIGETIETVLSQTYEHWELIIIDDGSQDRTEQIIANFNSPKITYVKIEHCGIFGKVRNHGLRMAKGEYAAFLDSDDLWTAQKLEKQIELLQAHPQADFVFSNVHFFGTGTFQQPREYENFFVGHILTPMLEEKRFVFYPSTLVFRTRIIGKIGLIDESLPFTTDLKYFLSMCQHFQGIFVNERLVSIRKHSHNTTRDVPPGILAENIQILQSIFEEGAISKPFYKHRLAHYYYKMGLLQLEHKERWTAVLSFRSYISIKPFHWKGWVRLAQAIFSPSGHVYQK